MMDSKFSLGRFVAGWLIVAASAYGARLDASAAIQAKEALHTSHLALLFGGALFGIIVAFSWYVLPVLKQLLADAKGTKLPFIGGSGHDT